MAILTKNSKFQIPNSKSIPLFNHLTNYHLINFRCSLGFGAWNLEFTISG